MKFRTLSGLDQVVSEVGFAVAATPGADSLQAARMARLAYDEGINFFLLPAGSLHDGVLAPAFSGSVRSNVSLAASIMWPGAAAFERLQAAIEFRLAGLATDRIDVLLLRNVPGDRILDGSVADAIHRLRAAGKVRSVGLSEAGGAPLTSRDLARSGAPIIEFLPSATGGFSPGFERPADSVDVSAITRISPSAMAESDPLSFLWNGTGRTRIQSVVSLALSAHWVSSVFVGAMNDEELREAARAPLAPAFSDIELSAARANRGAVLTEA